VVCEASKSRGGSRAKKAGAAQPLGRGRGLTPAVISRVEVEEIVRLGDHRAGSFCSMNFIGSKLIERDARLSSIFRKIAVSSR
jgi:hypothetical protein